MSSISQHQLVDPVYPKPWEPNPSAKKFEQKGWGALEDMVVSWYSILEGITGTDFAEKDPYLSSSSSPSKIPAYRPYTSSHRLLTHMRPPALEKDLDIDKLDIEALNIYLHKLAQRDAQKKLEITQDSIESMRKEKAKLFEKQQKELRLAYKKKSAEKNWNSFSQVMSVVGLAIAIGSGAGGASALALTAWLISSGFSLDNALDDRAKKMIASLLSGGKKEYEESIVEGLRTYTGLSTTALALASSNLADSPEQMFKLANALVSISQGSSQGYQGKLRIDQANNEASTLKRESKLESKQDHIKLDMKELRESLDMMQRIFKSMLEIERRKAESMQRVTN